MCAVAERDRIMRTEGEEMSSGQIEQAANMECFLHRTVREDFSKLRLRIGGVVFEEMVR